ncbi:uncharacterized protein LOC120414315 [Culex pipiens pallens]|nr:uncharacterized protein LOC120414315 [Culex pipiens pallens]
MPTCQVKTCGATRSNPNVTLHQFPKNPAIRNRWLNFSHSREGPNLFICSRHFLPADYENILMTSSRRKLRKEAVPTIHDPIESDRSSRASVRNRKKLVADLLEEEEERSRKAASYQAMVAEVFAPFGPLDLLSPGGPKGKADLLSQTVAEPMDVADDMIEVRSGRINTSGCVSSALLGERDSDRRDVRPDRDNDDLLRLSSALLGERNSNRRDVRPDRDNDDLRRLYGTVVTTTKQRSKSSFSAASASTNHYPLPVSLTVEDESSPERNYSVLTSPISISAAPILEGYYSSLNRYELANSEPSSPESGAQEPTQGTGNNHHHYPSSSNNKTQSSSKTGGSTGQSSSLMSASANSNVVRTSQSEDHLHLESQTIEEPVVDMVANPVSQTVVETMAGTVAEPMELIGKTVFDLMENTVPSQFELFSPDLNSTAREKSGFPSSLPQAEPGFVQVKRGTITKIKKENFGLRGIIRSLRAQLKAKDQIIGSLSCQNKQKSNEIQQLRNQHAQCAAVLEHRIREAIDGAFGLLFTKNQTDLILGRKKKVKWTDEEIMLAFALRYSEIFVRTPRTEIFCNVKVHKIRLSHPSYSEQFPDLPTFNKS